MHALAATGAGLGIAPGFVQVGDDARVGPAAHYIPGVRAFDLAANADATRAEDAAIVIENEPIVGCVDCRRRVEIWEADVRHSVFGRQGLQFAMTVRNAD